MSHFDHRHTNTRVLLRQGDAPLTNTDITIEHTQHAFGFGNIGFEFVDWIAGPPTGAVERSNHVPTNDMDALATKWLDVFNMATLPFYWRHFEPAPGHPETDRLMATARWFTEKGVTVKGHPLLWHTLAPQWLMDLDDATVESTIRDRITRDVTQFAGVIDLWDAINEVVILPVFTAEDNAVTRLAQKKGRVEMVRLAFDTAQAANPNGRFVLNDFDLSEDYEHLIEDCLAAGIRIDAIGLQTHMHQGFRGAEEIWDRMERFSRFGLPLQLTETTLVSGDLMPPHIVDLNDYVVDDWPTTPQGEARQAQNLIDHYTAVFSHPATESLTYWGITDHGAWLGAPCGLLRKDGTAKPGYDAIHDLITRQWTTPTTTQHTSTDGGVDITGFAGTYRITTPHGTTDVTLPAGTHDPVTVTVGE